MNSRERTLRNYEAKCAEALKATALAAGNRSNQTLAWMPDHGTDTKRHRDLV